MSSESRSPHVGHRGCSSAVTRRAYPGANPPANPGRTLDASPTGYFSRMRTLRYLLTIAAALIGIAAVAATATAAERDFSLRFSDTTNGNIAFAGNSLMTCTPSNAGCTDARTGVGTKLNNNDYDMLRVNTLSGDGAATAASASTLSLPADATVLFAGLYWSARSSSAARGRVALIDPKGKRTDITAVQLDEIGGTKAYFAFADVTPLVDSAGVGSYTVADVQADTGKDKYAGWSLVVAYASRSEEARNLTVFDGAREVSAGAKSTITIPISGFLAPPSGQVNTTVGFVAGEGDRSSVGDFVRLNGVNMQNALNPANNVANATASRLGSEALDRAPSWTNLLGWDVDTFNADGIIANGATSATLTATTSGETYYPQVLSLATEVYAPDIQLQKSVTDINGGAVERGDVLEYTVTATNVGSDAAASAILRDPVPGSTDFVPGSIRVNGTPVTDATADDAGAYYSGSSEVIAALGTGTVPAGGTMAVGAVTTVTFRTTVRDTLANGSSITNRARADYKAATGGLPLGSESNLVPAAITAPDLTISKSANDFAQGGTATWTMTVRNVGGTRLTSKVTVADEIPAGVTGVRASGSGWTCEVIPARVICQRPGPVEAGGSTPPITLTGRVGNGARVVNVARVTSDQDQNPENDYALTENVFNVPKINVDFGTTVAVSDRRPIAGDRITVTAGYRHYDGVPATSRISVSLPSTIVPAGASLRGDAEGDCTIAGTTVTCTVGVLREGEGVTLTITARVSGSVSGGTTIVSTIQPTGGDVDPAQGNNQAAVIVGVLPPQPAVSAPTSIEITKSAVGPAPAYGAVATWRVTVRNTGTATAGAAYFQDQLPATATLVSATVTGGAACTNRGGVVRCDLGDLAPGAERSATIRARYYVIGEVTNGATAYANDGVRDRGSATVDVYPARLRVAITTPRRWGAGQVMPATATIRGTGPLTARGTKLSVTIPAGVGVVAAPGFTITRNSGGATVLTRSTGNLRQGARRAFALQLQAPTSARRLALTDAGTASNTAKDTARTPAYVTRTPVTG